MAERLSHLESMLELMAIDPENVVYIPPPAKEDKGSRTFIGERRDLLALFVARYRACGAFPSPCLILSDGGQIFKTSSPKKKKVRKKSGTESAKKSSGAKGTKNAKKKSGGKKRAGETPPDKQKKTGLESIDECKTCTYPSDVHQFLSPNDNRLHGAAKSIWKGVAQFCNYLA
jgi:hypothetical protein